MAKLNICNQRLANQHLIKQSLEKPSDVVRLLGAVQAQDYGVAKWGVAQRTLGATDADVEQELSDGAILRTHGLRPRRHLEVAVGPGWVGASDGARGAG